MKRLRVEVVVFWLTVSVISLMDHAEAGVDQVGHAEARVDQVDHAEAGAGQVDHAEAGIDQVDHAEAGVDQVDHADADVGQVGRVVRQVLEQHLAPCHVVLLEETQHNSILPKIVRDVFGGVVVGVVVVEAQQVLSLDQAASEQLQQGLWGDPTRNCRAILVFLDNSVNHTNSDNSANHNNSDNSASHKNIDTNNNSSSNINSSSLVFRFLEWCGLWQYPETRVVVVGAGAEVRRVLLHHSLRNTLHALYLALDDLRRSSSPRTRPSNGFRRGVGGQVWRRCLYCDHGDAGVQSLLQANLTSAGPLRPDGFFNDQMVNMQGHKSRIVTRPYFPFVHFELQGDASKPVTPLDSLDVRMLTAISAHLNFTYEMWDSPDRQWGVPGTGGIWMGIIGELQHQRADHTMMLMLTPGRSRVVQFSTLYANDPMIIVSLKPQPLPRHLSIIRPFPDSVWQLLLASMVGWSVSLWVMQKAWSRLMGGRSFKLSYSFNFGWAILLGNPQDNIPPSLMARILVGCWLVACLVLSSAYRSALMAHLAVQEYSRPVNSFQELVKRPGFTWSAMRDVRSSAFREFFTENGPLMRQIYNKMEIREMLQCMDQVVKGRHAFIVWKNLVKPVIARLYTDGQGQNPFVLSTSEYPYLLGYSWGYRRGAPFRLRFATLQQRLIEAGLVDYWLEDVMAINKSKVNKQTSQYQEGAGGEQLVLGLDHLQGAFYILLLGCCLGLLVLLAEHLAHFRHTCRLQAHSPPSDTLGHFRHSRRQTHHNDLGCMPSQT